MAVEIDHLGIAVRSIDESLRFYGLLGLEPVAREIVEAERVSVAMLPLGAVPASSRLELLEATDDESPIARFIAKRGPGLHHIALKVDDLQRIAAELQAEGARLLNEPRAGAGGHLYIFVHPASSGGVLLELVER